MWLKNFLHAIPLSEKFLQGTSKLMPKHLPQIMWDYRNQYEHHLILKMGGKGVEEAREYLQRIFFR